MTDTVSKTIRNHSITFGTDLRYNIGSNLQRNAPAGTYNFVQQTTAGVSGGGNTYATFLLGDVSAAQAGSAAATVTVTGGETDRSLDGSFLIEDDWQATPRFAINAGLRYDYPEQTYEQNNGYSNFNTTAVNPLTGLRGELQVASPNARNFIHENYLNFGPRLGFAYSLSASGKSVLRGGYGIYYQSIFNSIFTGLTNGFSTATTSYTTPFQFSAGLPHQPTQPAAPGSTSFAGLFLGGAVAFQPARSPTPMPQQWTLSVEQQIPYQIVLQATYAANRGIHFPEGNMNLNQLTQQQINQVLANPGVTVTSPCANANGAKITLAQSLVSFPCYLSVAETTPHEGSYNGQYLELSAPRTAAHGLTMLFGYTFGKLLDDSINPPIAYLSSATNINGFQNIYNSEAEYSLDPTDVSQRATVSALYDLPFGKRTHLSAHNGGLISGYQANVIAVFQTGFPLAISGDSLNSYATRPNFVPGVSPKLANRTKFEWFNTAAFVNAPQVPNRTFGNVPRTLANVRSPGAEEFDISAFKTTDLTERLALQLRVETFNTFNYVNLSAPGTTFSSASATGPNNNTNFGVISSASPGRQIQLAATLIF